MYVVAIGLEGGYLPDTVEECETFEDAYAYAVDAKRSYLDDGYTVELGNLRRDYLVLLMPSDVEEHTLGTIIQIIESEE